MDQKLVKKKTGEVFTQEEIDELVEKASKVDNLENLVESLTSYKEKFEELDQKYSILVIFLK